MERVNGPISCLDTDDFQTEPPSWAPVWSEKEINKCVSFWKKGKLPIRPTQKAVFFEKTRAEGNSAGRQAVAAQSLGGLTNTGEERH